ncbi:hypothetical protein D3C73_915390 [compost metagenome]
MADRQVHGGLHRPAFRRTMQIGGRQRPIQRQGRLGRFEAGRRRDGADDELGRRRAIGARRQVRRQQAGEEAVPVADQGGDIGHALGFEEGQQLASLGRIAAPVVRAVEAVALGRPVGLDALGQVLPVGAPVQHADRIAPQLPARGRAGQPILQPLFLAGAQHAAGRSVAARVGQVLAAEADRCGRAAGQGAARVKRLDRVLGRVPGEAAHGEGCGVRALGRRLGAEGAVVGQDQLDIGAPAQGAVDQQAVDGRMIVPLMRQAVGVEIGQRRVLHRRRQEAL